MIKEIIVTPKHEAIEDAADFIGIEPERMAAAIGLYKHHTRAALTTVPDEAIVERVARALWNKAQPGFGAIRIGWEQAGKANRFHYQGLAGAAIAATQQQKGTAND